LLIIIGLTIAEQAGLISYAPAFSASPVTGNHLERSWLTSLGINILLSHVLVGAVVFYFLYRLRDRERAVTLLSEQLGRATSLISRYVPSQVARQIMAGQDETLSRHERRKLTIFFSDLVGF